MAVTAFPVLARIVADRGLIRTEVGGLALASAAVDDVFALVAAGGRGGGRHGATAALRGSCSPSVRT